MQSIFNQGTFFYWMGGVGFGTAIIGGFTGGAAGFVCGGILGSGAGVYWWFTGLQIANDGILSIPLPFGHPWTKWPAPVKS